MVIPLVIGALGTVTKGLIQRLEDLEYKDKWRPSIYSVIEIDKNTEESPGNLSEKPLAKNSKRSKIIIIRGLCYLGGPPSENKRNQKER